MERAGIIRVHRDGLAFTERYGLAAHFTKQEAAAAVKNIVDSRASMIFPLPTVARVDVFEYTLTVPAAAAP